MGERVAGIEHANEAAQQYLNDDATGAKPEFICGLPTEWIPEYDEFDTDSGRLIARGWRSILLVLISKHLINTDKARRIFSCHGLGLDDYDKVGYETRLKWARDDSRFSNKKKLVLP